MFNNLLWHKFSVQEGMHAKDVHGAVHRTNFKLKWKDIPCQIQGIEKEDISLQYNIKSREHGFCIYFNLLDYYIDESMRILISNDPKNSLPSIPSNENCKIYEFKGFNVPVNTRFRRLKPVELYVEENNRWII